MNRISALALTALTLILPLSAQAQDESVGTVIIAHGGTEEWNAPVLELAHSVETGGPVEVSFLMGDGASDATFQNAVERLVQRGASRVVVVPLLASSYSGHYEQIRYLAGARDDLPDELMHHLMMGGIHRPEVSVPTTLTPAFDASMEVAEILTARALSLAEAPMEQALFIIGHGPGSAEDYAAWMANLRPVADSVAKTAGFRDVKLGLVRDDAPAPVRSEAVRRIREIIELQHQLTKRSVVVVPILISSGTVSNEKLPTDLEGLDVVYAAQGLTPHPLVAHWIERRVREATAEP